MEILAPIRKLIFPAPVPPSYSYKSFPLHTLFLPTPLGSCPLFFLPHSSATVLILFAHGNGCDIGQMHETCLYYKQQLKVHFVVFEYPGYGLFQLNNDGKQLIPSEQSINQIIGCILFQFIKSTLKFPLERVILFGQSIGSGPVCWIASQCNTTYKVRLGGVILQSPFTSLRNVVSDLVGSRFVASWIGEMWTNDLNLRNVREPVCIIHGRADKSVE